MSRSLRRGALAAAAIVLSIGSLAACGAGNDAQTLEIKPDNAAAEKGDIQVQNALVITQPVREAKGPAVVSATLFNNGQAPQTLDAITLPGASGTVKLKAAEGSGKIVVPAHGSIILGGKGNASAVIENGRDGLENGAAQEVVFQFSRTGDIGLDAFVVPATGYFGEYGPSERPALPSPTASPTPSASASGEAGHGGQATPSGSAGTPSGTAATPSGSASHGTGH
ncbi:DUF461 domain-containing protein [Streptomyces sp. NPDC101118]|uniref:DUF461 domain-containing protein n=1 Tax=Streptomyces sp. NPDC101118 TaxID=3366109 RepID=UPI00381D2B12